jgi:hypothetical protein
LRPGITSVRLGEVALAALPPQLRDLSERQMQRRMRRKDQHVRP